MGQATSLLLREQILAFQSQGLGPKAISEQLSLAYGTVKHLCRKFKSCTSDEIGPKYANCGRKGALSKEKAKSLAVELRQRHPQWGAPRIRVELQLRGGLCGQEEQVSVRTLQRLFRKKGLSPARAQSGQPAIGRSLAPHNIWEVDAKERFHLPDGTPACYLTIADEKTGAWLEAPVFPLCPHQPSPRSTASTDPGTDI